MWHNIWKRRLTKWKRYITSSFHSSNQGLLFGTLRDVNLDISESQSLEVYLAPHHVWCINKGLKWLISKLENLHYIKFQNEKAKECEVVNQSIIARVNSYNLSLYIWLSFSFTIIFFSKLGININGNWASHYRQRKTHRIILVMCPFNTRLGW